MKNVKDPFKKWRRKIIKRGIKPCLKCGTKKILIDIEFFPKNTGIPPIPSVICLECGEHSCYMIENAKRWQKEAVLFWNKMNK